MTNVSMDRISNAPGTCIPAPEPDSPRERLERLLVVLLRTRRYVGSAVAVALAGAILSALMVIRMPRVWRSEVTVLYRDTIQTDRPGGSPTQRAALLGPRLKEMIEVRSHLSFLITEFDLYPEVAARSMVDAVDEMRKHVGFRPRKGVTFVVSFSHGDPVMARNVTARLAEMIITEYHRENMETTSLNRDFLRRELVQAQTNVDDASRSLSSFLLSNPQFQWGMNDSPYAQQSQSVGGAPIVIQPNIRRLPVDPELAAMRQKLGAIEDELRRTSPSNAPGDATMKSPGLTAQKQRDAAEAAVNAAQQALDEKLRTVTPAHPDASAARARLQAARDSLAAAERQVGAAQTESAPAPSPTGNPDPRRDALEGEREMWLRRIDDRLRKLQASASAGSPAESAPDAGAAPGARANADSNSSATSRIIELETEWHRLRLDLERARDHFRMVQAKERAANMSADAAEKKSDDELVILDPAYVPARPEQGPGRMVMAGLVATLLMSFGVAFLRVLLNDTLFDERDIRAAGGSTLLAELPRMSTPRPQPREPAATGREPPADEIPISWDPASERTAELHALVRLPPALREPRATQVDVQGFNAVVEIERNGAMPKLASLPGPTLGSLRVLRHRLEQLRRGEHFVVSVVSPGAGDGKTTVALQLAMILSETKRSRVALVEGHFGHPSLGTVLGLDLPATEGFSSQIRQRIDGCHGPLVVARIAPSLVVLAEPALPRGCPEALHSVYFDNAVCALREAYDYVLIDGSSVLGAGDAHVLESLSDAVIMVARSGVTAGRDLRKAERQLGGQRILGTVLNDLPVRP